MTIIAGFDLAGSRFLGLGAVLKQFGGVGARLPMEVKFGTDAGLVTCHPVVEVVGLEVKDQAVFIVPCYHLVLLNAKSLGGIKDIWIGEQAISHSISDALEELRFEISFPFLHSIDVAIADVSVSIVDGSLITALLFISVITDKAVVLVIAIAYVIAERGTIPGYIAVLFRHVHIS
jgi:hypothetical protein